MAFNRGKFLIEILGPSGAQALAKAADRSEFLSQALIPRTIMAWLTSSSEFEGLIPGSSDRTVSFQKSEAGFTGKVQLSKTEYSFNDQSVFHVAGAIAVAVGIDSATVSDEVRNLDLERLGKSIDLMAKVQKVAKIGKCKECGGRNGGHLGRLVAGIVLKCKSDKPKADLEKDELEKGINSNSGGAGPAGQGAHVGPKGPTPNAPAAAAAPAAEAPVTPKVPKMPKMGTSSTSIKLTRSETSHPCPVCSSAQFKGDEFVGCTCFSALSKSVTTVKADDNSVTIQLGPEWDRDSKLTFFESVGRV